MRDLFLRIGFICFCLGGAVTQKHPLAPYEAYLNQIQTLEADFLESNSNGTRGAGKLYLTRIPLDPGQKLGRLRVIYHPPRGEDVLTCDNAIVFHDRLNEETSQVALDATPLELLLRPLISFERDVIVQNIGQKKGYTGITLAMRSHPDSGGVTLVFSDKPLALKQWIIRQSNGVITTITLNNMRMNQSIDRRFFQFREAQEAP